jgi:hypothetical protein
LRGWCRRCLQNSLLPHKSKDAKSDPVRDQTRTLLPPTLSKTILGTTTDALLCHAQTLNSTKTHFFPRTIIAWNHVDNKTFHSASPECFKSTLAKATRR